MRDWGDVFDAGDFDAGVLDGTDGGLSTRPWALHLDVDFANAVLHGSPSRSLSSLLGGIRGGLARTLEANVAAGCPAEDVALLVADGDDGVVEAGLDVGHAMSDVLAFSTTRLAAWALPLLTNLLLASDGALGTLASTSVGLGALSPNGQALAVADALVATDFHLSLDVLADLATRSPSVLTLPSIQARIWRTRRRSGP